MRIFILLSAFVLSSQFSFRFSFSLFCYRQSSVQLFPSRASISAFTLFLDSLQPASPLVPVLSFQFRQIVLVFLYFIH